MMTPYEKLKSLANAETYLRDGVTFESLDHQALAISDLEAAKKLQTAKSKLFAEITSKEQIILHDAVNESSIRVDKSDGQNVKKQRNFCTLLPTVLPTLHQQLAIYLTIIILKI